MAWDEWISAIKSVWKVRLKNHFDVTIFKLVIQWIFFSLQGKGCMIWLCGSILWLLSVCESQFHSYARLSTLSIVNINGRKPIKTVTQIISKLKPVKKKADIFKCWVMLNISFQYFHYFSYLLTLQSDKGVVKKKHQHLMSELKT